MIRQCAPFGLATLAFAGPIAAAPDPGDIYLDRQAFYAAFGNEVVIDFESSPVGPVVGDPWLTDGVMFDEAGVGDNMAIGPGVDLNIYCTTGQASDIEITFPTPVVAFGLGIYSNNIQSSSERIIFYGANNVVLLDHPMPLTMLMTSEFVGYHGTEPIHRVEFVEDDDGDYVGIGDVALVLDTAVGTSYCGPAFPNSTGSPATISAMGSTVVGDNNVVLTANNMPQNQFGYFLAGQTQGFFNPPGSQGIICLSANIGRYNQVANIIQGPTGSIQLDLTAIPVNPPQAVVPGDTWNFQCWYRDLNPGATTNFTDAVSVTFQ